MNNLAQWVHILFRGFVGKPPSREDMAFYEIGLADLPPEKLDVAFRETIRRHPTDFRPMPGQIRRYMESALASAPPRPSDADTTCAKCSGTGWVIVDTAETGNYADLCDCVKRARASRPRIA